MNLKPNQNLRKESVKYKSNKKYKYLLFSGLALCSLSLEAKLNNDKVKAESEKTQTATKLEKDPLTGFSNTKRNIAFNDNPLLQEDTGNTSFNNSLVTVNKDNFTSHFVLNGSAKWSVTKDNRGILRLTDDVINQAGNATLSTKISVNDDFHLTGKINLGTRSAGQGGADGIALAFHTGDSNQIGAGGGCLGIAGLPYGFGFKLDTFYNEKGQYSDNGAYEDDPPQFNTTDGNRAFGAFAYDKIKNNVSTVITYDEKDAPAQKISEPVNNTFRDFQADYDGATHVLTVNYDNKTWSKSIDSWIPANTTSLSFVITGVTGGSRNLQEFEINEFKYTGYGVVN
ncbi:MAG: lectin-like domain-containing protein, partial [Lactobacillaceae bacterium]